MKKYARRLLDLSILGSVNTKDLGDMCKIFLDLLDDLGLLQDRKLAGISIPATYYMLNKWADRDPPASRLVPICETGQEDHHVFINPEEHTCPVCNAARSDASGRRYIHI